MAICASQVEPSAAGSVDDEVRLGGLGAEPRRAGGARHQQVRHRGRQPHMERDPQGARL